MDSYIPMVNLPQASAIDTVSNFQDFGLVSYDCDGGSERIRAAAHHRAVHLGLYNMQFQQPWGVLKLEFGMRM